MKNVQAVTPDQAATPERLKNIAIELASMVQSGRMQAVHPEVRSQVAAISIAILEIADLVGDLIEQVRPRTTREKPHWNLDRLMDCVHTPGHPRLDAALRRLGETIEREQRLNGGRPEAQIEHAKERSPPLARAVETA